MGIIILLLPLVLIFFMMQSQRKKAAQQQQLLASLVEGDDVVTTAGLYGTITWIGKEEAFLEIADGVEVHVVKGAIARKVDMATTEAARVSEDGQDVSAEVGEQQPSSGATSATGTSTTGTSATGSTAVGSSSANGAALDSPDGEFAGVDEVPAPIAEPKRRRLGGTK